MSESSEKAMVGGWLMTLLALLALLALSGCDRKPADPPQPKATATALDGAKRSASSP